ncbi:MAG: FKBP-type peptidyl-prolyl cis-trans isomerase [Micropepsaceae bacterium]
MVFGRLAFVALAALSISGCVFDLSSDDPKPKTRAAEACPPRDEGNWAKMQAFLAANKSKDGVKVTESGLQYRVLTAGAGSRHPTWASIVQVRYKGALTDGSVFDENKAPDAPMEFEAGGVIKGWQEALELMREGDKLELVIPSGLGYGCRGKGNKIKADQVLVFEVELLKIK